jgi:hypothetical protein
MKGGAMGPDDIFWKLVAEFCEDPEVEDSTMMGHDCLRFNGEFFGMISGGGHLIVKLPAARVNELVDAGAGENVAPAGKVFREWVAIPEPDETIWRGYLGEAKEFAGSRFK